MTSAVPDPVAVDDAAGCCGGVAAAGVGVVVGENGEGPLLDGVPIADDPPDWVVVTVPVD